MCKFQKNDKNKYGKIVNISSIVGHTGNLDKRIIPQSRNNCLSKSNSD